MSTLTRQHFNKLAIIVAKLKAGRTGEAIDELEVWISKSNPNFNFSRWRDAVDKARETFEAEDEKHG